VKVVLVIAVAYSAALFVSAVGPRAWRLGGLIMNSGSLRLGFTRYREMARIRASAEDIGGFLAFAADVVWDCAGVIEREVAEDVSDAFARADDLDLNSTNDHNYATAISTVSALARDLDHICARAHQQASSASETVYHVPGRDPVSAICSAITDARDLVVRLADDLSHAVDLAGQVGERKAREVAASAAGLVTAATWLLPAADRARYRDEYWSELWDLARSGDRRLRQLRYALRQLCHAVPMGVALRSPHRRGAAP
jgi:hypothetical protein